MSFKHCFYHGSFHVGTMSENPAAYQGALAVCAELFQYGADIGYDFTLLDIGGGFPGEKNSHELFGRMADAIKLSLSKHFSPVVYPHLRVIAEPGICDVCSIVIAIHCTVYVQCCSLLCMLYIMCTSCIYIQVHGHTE